MEEEVISKKRYLHRLYILIKWIVPISILTIIFTRIDITKIEILIKNGNVSLFIIGIFLYIVLNLIGSLRWRTIIYSIAAHKLPFKFVIKHYWIGMALGFFLPASIGWDAYRITVAGKRIGRYAINVYAIIIEKGLAFFTMLIMIIITSPFTKKYLIDSQGIFEKVLEITYILFIILLILCIAIISIFKFPIFQNMITIIENFISRIKENFIKKLGLKTHNNSQSSIIEYLINKKGLGYTLLLSFSIITVSAIKNQIFFRALGYDLPVIINFLLVPIFFFIWLLPITFGSIGIREGTFILFYGLFGVPAEVALTVSFLNLFGILINNAIGGILILINNIQTSNLLTEKSS